MIVSKVHEPGLVSSVVPSLKWGVRSAILIIRVFIRKTSSRVVILIVYIDDILRLGMLLLVLRKLKSM